MSERKRTDRKKAGAPTVALARRDFLKAAEAAAIAAGWPFLFDGCAPAAPPTPTPAPARPPRGTAESWVVSVCGGCPGGCGIRARRFGDRLVGISGSSLHPVNRGGLCPLGAAGAAIAYHPDRVKGPLRRLASGDLRSVGWPEAMAEVATRLRDLRARGAPHALAIVDGHRGLASQAVDRFLSAFGSPNHLPGRPWNDTVSTPAMRAMQGVEAPAAYDLEKARFVLAFGSGWLEGSWSPVGSARAFGMARRGRKASRLRVVHVEPRLSVSASHADEWVPILPGTEGTLALGLMHMVLREGLEDREFLDRWGFGFDLLRAIVLRDYHPDAVSERTGVPVATIVRLARRFASTRPALAIGDDRVGPGAQPPETRMAIHALNALVGAVNSPGGVLTPTAVPADPLPNAKSDEIGARGRAGASLDGTPRPRVESLIEGSTYPIQMVVAYGSDPLALLGGGSRERAALRRVPFIVSVSSFLDETARMADLVLPEPTYLERWQDDPCFTSRGFPVLGLRQPVIEPRHDTRPAPEVLAEIARAVGGPVADTFAWKDFREVVKTSVRGVHRSGRGALFDVAEAEPWVETLERGGWRASNFGSFDQFWDGLVERGGWWDPIYDFGERARVLRTPSGRFDFQPLVTGVAAALGGGRGGQFLLASPPARADFPLRLHLYPLFVAFGNGFGPLPWVQDMLGRELGQAWTVWVELAPSDAKSLGIVDGDTLRVESAQASIEARARVYAGVHPGVVAVPVGPGGAGGQVCRRALAELSGCLAPTRSAEGPLGEVWVRVRRA